MTKRYTFEMELQTELTQEQQDDLEYRLAAQLEGGEFGLYYKFKLKPIEVKGYCPHPGVFRGEQCPLCKRIAGSAQ